MDGWKQHKIRDWLAAAAMAACAAAFGAIAASSDASPSPASGARTTSPAPTASAIALSHQSGPPGAQITVSGSGFPPGGTLDLYLDDPSHSLGLYGTAGPDGAFSFTPMIMSAPGAHRICVDSYGTPATSVPQVLACAAYTLTDFQPTLMLDPTEAPYSTSVKITGQGFPPNEIAALYADIPNPYLSTPGPIIDPLGQFSTPVVLQIAGGTHQICADTGYPGSNQQFKAKACATFTVMAPSSIVIGPTTAPVAGSSPSGGSVTAPTPAAATLRGNTGFPLWPPAGAVALAVVAGAGAFFWFRLRAKSP